MKDMAKLEEENMGRQFAESLNDILDERGLSGDDFGFMSGISPSTVSKYRNGRQTPSVGRAGHIATLLGVSLDYMLNGERRKAERGEAGGRVRDLHLRRLDPSVLDSSRSPRRGARRRSSDG